MLIPRLEVTTSLVKVVGPGVSGRVLPPGSSKEVSPGKGLDESCMLRPMCFSIYVEWC